MTEFVKLYGSILDSTVWLESLPTKVIWITMLAMADWEGFVSAAVPTLAKRAGVTRAECETALAVLGAPDPDSKTKEFEGRRVEPREGGWLILNHGKYRDMRTETQVRTAARVKKHRGQMAGNGYVYYAATADRIKIGFSKNPQSRVAELKCAIPDLELIAMEPGTIDLERHRHKQFAESRLNREWFAESADLDKHLNSLGAVTVTNVTNGNGVKRSVRADKDKDKTTTPAKSGGWVGRFLTAYTEATKGSYSAGRLGRELKDLIRDNGENPAFIAWTAFLASPDRKYGPPYFAKNYVDYAKRNGSDPAHEQFVKRGYLL